MNANDQTTHEVTIPVESECEYRHCTREPWKAFVVTGDVGDDGVASYCRVHTLQFAQSSQNHTPLGDVRSATTTATEAEP